MASFLLFIKPLMKKLKPTKFAIVTFESTASFEKETSPLIGVYSLACSLSPLEFLKCAKPTMSVRMNLKMRLPLECISPWSRLPKGVKKHPISMYS